MMKTLGRRLLSLTFILSLLPAVTLAQKLPTDWKKVKKITWSKAVVMTKTGERLEGQIVKVTDDALQIKILAQPQAVPKSEVAEVRKLKGSKKRTAAFALGLGAAGFAIGALIGEAANPHDDSGLGPFGPIVGGAIGAAGGAVTGVIVAGKTQKDLKEELIYQSP
jgi:hypothetical protein